MTIKDFDLPGGAGADHCVSMDATQVSTEISAADRALTARLLAAPATQPAEVIRPDHVVPARTAASPE
jgi:3,4-dihydroxy 2-butanone 4-phosphate synthase / GTP cyclohydrolase II